MQLRQVKQMLDVDRAQPRIGRAPMRLAEINVARLLTQRLEPWVEAQLAGVGLEQLAVLWRQHAADERPAEELGCRPLKNV